MLRSNVTTDYSGGGVSLVEDDRGRGEGSLIKGDRGGGGGRGSLIEGDQGGSEGFTYRG